MRGKYIAIGIVVGVVLGVLLTSAVVVLAGNLNPPSGPTDAASQMYTLEQIYDRLDTGAAGSKMTTFTEPASGPGTGTMHTLDEVYDLIGERAPVPKTGETDCHRSALPWGTCTCGHADCPFGQDGDLEKGVAWPSPRFTDNLDGTVTDNLTGLIWLKEANCPNDRREWGIALMDVVKLNASGTMNGNPCNDTSNGGSHQSDWRLPNARELYSLIDSSQYAPALPSGHPFTGVQSDRYWSSTTFAGNTEFSLFAFLGDGTVAMGSKPNAHYVWPVRGGQRESMVQHNAQ
jgi:hypothetical protein